MKQNNNSGSGTLLDPIIDLVVILIELLIDLIIAIVTTLVGWIFGKVFKAKLSVITDKHLKYSKSSSSSEDLGRSAITKKNIKLSSLKTHLHTLIIGASGWGKSNTLNLLFENSIQKNIPIVFIDPKANRQSLSEFTSLCSYYKKEMFIFDEHQQGHIKFDLFSKFKSDEIVTMIMRSIEWSEIYYKSIAQSFLFTAIDALNDRNIPVTLISIYKYLEEKHKNNKELAGLRSNLQMIYYSSFSKMLDFNQGDIDRDLVVNLAQIKERKASIYIGLSTQGKGDIARFFGKIFLNQILMISHYAGFEYDTSEEAIKNGMSFVMEEAGSMVFPDFLELLNKCRSSGIQIYACVQTLSDFDAIDTNFKEQCFENFGTIITLKQSETRNAKYISESIGTIQTRKETEVVEDGMTTGRKSIREAKEFICHPDFLKKLPIGKAVVLTRNPYSVDLINIRYVSDSAAFNSSLPTGKALPPRVDRQNQLKFNAKVIK